MNTIDPTNIRCLDSAHGDNWSAYNGDSVDVLRQFPDRCIDLMVYSPPFSDVFVYSDSERDMGNARNHAEFEAHYGYLVDELFRLMRPGRIVAVHCKAIPYVLYKHNRRGLFDLPGVVIRAHERAGFEYHSEVCIWKDPVVEMQRTKANGLLHMQLLKDSAKSRQGLPDKLIILRKPDDDGDYRRAHAAALACQDADLAQKYADAIRDAGGDVVPVAHPPATFPVDLWQQWASPVWMDIDQGDTLNRAEARESDDEKHICPLQLDVIERVVTLWSNPGEVVLTPFGGIGSEPVMSLRCGRKAVAVELKPAYFGVQVKNLKAEESVKQLRMFHPIDVADRNAPTPRYAAPVTVDPDAP